ncbi:MAG: [protein-PII] uridylyltransferase [Acidiferrobacteraceae bacterium]
MSSEHHSPPPSHTLKGFEQFAEHPDTVSFRALLREGSATLKAQFYEIAPQRLYAQAAHIVHQQTVLVDRLLISAWNKYQQRFATSSPMALVAVGGYGRGELHPHSDVDLMLLYEGRAASIKDFSTAYLALLWDTGLSLGHSVRTPRDCLAQSRRDVTVATNIMEARLLAGDPVLFSKAIEGSLASGAWRPDRFLKAKLDEQRARYRRYDDTGYNLEPNVKEGPGGLRDIQMIAWLAQRCHGSRNLHDLVDMGFLRAQEYRYLIRARNFLWFVRIGLHYLAGRREDRLLFDHQRALAAAFGFRDQRGRHLAVEQLMKQYYRTVKNVELLNEILLQELSEKTLVRGRIKISSINRRFRTVNSALEARDGNVFRRFPFAILELFLILQQHPEIRGVRAATIRLLQENLHRIDSTFRRDLACRALFMEILRQPRGITHELRRMNAYGVLGRYIPAFGRIVGQMQHDLFHVYTVDEHILFVVRNLRRFMLPECVHEFPMASRLMQHLFKPERLYLAALFHDIAKGRGGDHSTLGERDARAFCLLHGLSEYDARFVCWLVRNHLAMSRTAQKEDITEPSVVLDFAKTVGDQEHLDNLYLLTVADMRGTSPAVWNTWKDRLLAQLHDETTRALRRGFGNPLDQKARVRDLKIEARQLLQDSHLSGTDIERHWERLDDGYFLRYHPDSIAWHTQTILSSRKPLPIVAARYRPARGATEVLVFSPDSAGLFAVLTAGLGRLNLSIVDARIHTSHEFALDTFVILNRDEKPVSDENELRHIEAAMRTQIARRSPGRPLGDYRMRAIRHFPIATEVSFSTPPAGGILMEVVTQDRPGLLYQVALALEQCQLHLTNARVATYGERVEDMFFISGGPCHGDSIPENTLIRLREDILRRLTISAAQNIPAQLSV